MYDVLIAIKAKLETIPDIATCQIGLEDDISPKDYPLIRIVAGRSSDLGFLNKKHEVKIYFGFDLNEYDGLEPIYEKLYTLDKQIYGAIVPNLEPYLCKWIDTISDEDRLKGYKVLCSVFSVESV